LRLKRSECTKNGVLLHEKDIFNHSRSNEELHR
jgi:hypothetical protein